MEGFESIRQLVSRLGGYNPLEVALELLVIGGVVYVVWRFVRGTRAAGALRGILVVLLVVLGLRLLAPSDAFERLAFLFDNLLGFAVVAVVIIFQPELRRAMSRIGEAPLFRGEGADVAPVVEALCSASGFLSKSKFGGLIAIERRVGLREFIETGKILNADVSAELIQSIFWPNSPLHDMGVVIRGNRIVAASVQFPLADPSDVSDAQMGTRHRAAIGLTRVSDALVIVVSEETGAISLAERGRLLRWLSVESLEEELRSRLARIVSEDEGASKKAEVEEETEARARQLESEGAA